jgi:hypothetical protein
MQRLSPHMTGINVFSIDCKQCNIRASGKTHEEAEQAYHNNKFQTINISFGCMDNKNARVLPSINPAFMDPNDSGFEKFNVNVLIHLLERFSTRLHELEHLNGKIRFELNGVKKDLHAVRMLLELRKGRKKDMAKLSTKARNKLPKSSFGEPGSRKYPMPDKSHARNAKARASQMVNKGKLSESEKSKIDAKANKVLGKPKAKADKPKSRAKSARGLSL